MAATRREFPDQLVTSVIGTEGVSFAKLLSGKKMLRLISDVCHGHRRFSIVASALDTQWSQWQEQVLAELE